VSTQANNTGPSGINIIFFLYVESIGSICQLFVSHDAIEMLKLFVVNTVLGYIFVQLSTYTIAGTGKP